MAKNFTYSVPNAQNVDKWDDNKTIDVVYTGNDIIFVNVMSGTLLDWSNDNFENAEEVYVVDTTAADNNTNAAIATLVQEANVNHVYTWANVTNFDGSVYEEMQNLQLHDYYDLKWLNGIPEIRAKVLDHKTEYEIEATTRKEYVTKYTKVYSFESADNANITAYLTQVDNFIESLNAAYTWNFTDINIDLVPKIPVTIVNLFNDLPNVN